MNLQGLNQDPTIKISFYMQVNSEGILRHAAYERAKSEGAPSPEIFLESSKTTLADCLYVFLRPCEIPGVQHGSSTSGTIIYGENTCTWATPSLEENNT